LGNRLRQVSLSEASAEIRKIYQNFFGDRDPVVEPGIATGTPGDYWTTFALVPDILQMSRDSLIGHDSCTEKLREILRGGLIAYAVGETQAYA
jgi:hypothetical protein